jgi:drug/metabolite transporter (DMT)-like permease
VTPATLGLILVSISFSAVAQISFKFGLTAVARDAPAGSMPPSLLQALFTPGVLAGLALYGLGTLLWLSALGRVQVSQAYPFVALGFVLTAILGRVIFGDALGPMRLAGIALVIAGVCLVARS